MHTVVKYHISLLSAVISLQAKLVIQLDCSLDSGCHRSSGAELELKK